MSDELLPRETGAEKSGEVCPSCDGDLPVVTTTYGSVRTGSCSSCSADETSVSDYLGQLQQLASDELSGGDEDAGDDADSDA